MCALEVYFNHRSQLKMFGNRCLEKYLSAYSQLSPQDTLPRRASLGGQGLILLRKPKISNDSSSLYNESWAQIPSLAI